LIVARSIVYKQQKYCDLCYRKARIRQFPHWQIEDYSRSIGVVWENNYYDEPDFWRPG